MGPIFKYHLLVSLLLYMLLCFEHISDPLKEVLIVMQIYWEIITKYIIVCMTLSFLY